MPTRCPSNSRSNTFRHPSTSFSRSSFHPSTNSPSLFVHSLSRALSWASNSARLRSAVSSSFRRSSSLSACKRPLRDARSSCARVRMAAGETASVVELDAAACEVADRLSARLSIVDAS